MSMKGFLGLKIYDLILLIAMPSISTFFRDQDISFDEECIIFSEEGYTPLLAWALMDIRGYWMATDDPVLDGGILEK
jgi:hypothetical protein